uniref:C3H1-type domain-containing protein n=1 Tax=Chromera velia CCMP2878 TaxID=1169474 RepID=A0A0G4HCG1_9ALVE|eukprot:Cvel_26168.t1-p1 / transcript=Cvel_26168.t1 / gene=Cvel_26168 / organism=Chromera_velia_CCMP2878 / gene_product=hypothetical protein / transcript_product=hypothetical protein / location=Cvel_scaffold3074:5447-10409(+) / protein_length=660 / sequence_SO=supercontig / SO=protein_coding / is_pseudo=false
MGCEGQGRIEAGMGEPGAAPELPVCLAILSLPSCGVPLIAYFLMHQWHQKRGPVPACERAIVKDEWTQRTKAKEEWIHTETLRAIEHDGGDVTEKPKAAIREGVRTRFRALVTGSEEEAFLSEDCLGFCVNCIIDSRDFLRESPSECFSAHSAIEFLPLRVKIPLDSLHDWERIKRMKGTGDIPSCPAHERKLYSQESFPCPYGPFCRYKHLSERLDEKRDLWREGGPLLMHTSRQGHNNLPPCWNAVLPDPLGRALKRGGTFGPCGKGESCQNSHFVGEADDRERDGISRSQFRLCWRMYHPFGCWKGMFLCNRPHWKPFPTALEVTLPKKERKRLEADGPRWLSFLLRRWLERAAIGRERESVREETKSFPAMKEMMKKSSRGCGVHEAMSLSSIFQERLRIVWSEWGEREKQQEREKSLEHVDIVTLSLLVIFRLRVALFRSLVSMLENGEKLDWTVRLVLFDGFVLLGDIEDTQSSLRAWKLPHLEDQSTEADGETEKSLVLLVLEGLEAVRNFHGVRGEDWDKALEACHLRTEAVDRVSSVVWRKDCKSRVLLSTLKHAATLPKGDRLRFLKLFFSWHMEKKQNEEEEQNEKNKRKMLLTDSNPSNSCAPHFFAVDPVTKDEMIAAGWLEASEAEEVRDTRGCSYRDLWGDSLVH